MTAAIATAGVLGSAYVGYKVYQSKKPKLPTEWKQVGTLKDLYVYPIKSVGPVVTEKAELTVMGLRQGWLRDRWKDFPLTPLTHWDKFVIILDSRLMCSFLDHQANKG